jgi:hypothetical protein
LKLHEHLLFCLAEECAEVAKECSKGARFSLQDHFQGNPSPSDKIMAEMADLMGAFYYLQDEGFLPKVPIDHAGIEAKIQKIKKYLEYSKEVGTLDD